jgi:hypothetical protein
MSYVRDQLTVRRDDTLISEELVVSSIGADDPVEVELRAAVPDPIVRLSQDDLDTILASSLDDMVKALQTVGTLVECPLGAIPELDVDMGTDIL